MRAIVVREHGGPEVLRLEEVPTPMPRGMDVLVRNEAIGVNFVDTQHRAGLTYPIELPLTPGVEAAGVVEAIGPDVTEFAIGDRVGYAGHMGGDYAEATLVPEARLIPVPAEVSLEIAAASLMQGMTAVCLSHRVYPIQAGDDVLIQAATSGVGLFLVQFAKARGATVVGTVSGAEKVEVARALGADHVVVSSGADFAAETMRLTGGAGVHVVYDGLGRATFDRGLGVLRARGTMVVYGLSSGPIPPLDVNRLSGITGASERGSLFVTWATLSDYTTRREDLLWHATTLFDALVAGRLQVSIARTFALAAAADAHRFMEGRRPVGKVMLRP